jgi:hypothetical protein
MKSINLRLDDDLHADLKEAARQSNRSLQQQIIWLLETGVGGDPAIVMLERRAQTVLKGDPK